MHSLLEKYYSGELSESEARREYLAGFYKNVAQGAPSQKVLQNYFAGGLRYLSELKPFPWETLAVETHVLSNLKGHETQGYIDLVCRDADGLIIIDHKSRDLKKRSKKAKPTKTDKTLDDYLRQLYIYSATVKDAYVEFPHTLCFNCFRTGVLIQEPFVHEKYEEALDWFDQSIQRIKSEQDFWPDDEWFKCKYLCDIHDYCEYYEGG